jgi:hypothetical protein
MVGWSEGGEPKVKGVPFPFLWSPTPPALSPLSDPIRTKKGTHLAHRRSTCQTTPGGISGRSQKTTSTLSSFSLSRARVSRVSRDMVATISRAFVLRHASSAFANSGRSLRRPLSTSTNSWVSCQCPPSKKALTFSRCASKPRPERPCRSVLTRKYETQLPLGVKCWGHHDASSFPRYR